MRHIALKKSTYRDSVTLMRISKQAGELEGVDYAMVAMATDTNLDLLRAAGFEHAGFEGADPNDLLIALELETDSVLDQAIELIEREIQGGPAQAGARAVETAEGFDATLRSHPEINLVLISLPGRYAAFEARKALEAGKHVMIFSDNVTVENEKQLKLFAHEQGLLVMGPDCGTAIINGIGLGFANEVPRGDIGMVAASGTGAQEVSSILARCHGAGISQLIGTGGRDVSRDVGGLMLKMGLRALIDDSATQAIVVVSKHPDREIADEIIEIAGKGGKPCVIHFTGQQEKRAEANLTFTRTLAETALEAARGTGKQIQTSAGFDADTKAAPLAAAGFDQGTEAEVLAAAAKMARGRKYIRGLFSGGTLAQEAVFLLSEGLEEIHTNLKIESFSRLDDPAESMGHTIVDLGDDTFTRGRAHPMIDQAYRLLRLKRELDDPECAIILLDVVLGHGCHPAPGRELAGAIVAAGGDDRPLVMASICGTHGDPQNYAEERRALEAAGVFVAEHNQGLCELALVAIEGRRDA